MGEGALRAERRKARRFAESYSTDRNIAREYFWGDAGIADDVWAERLRQIDKWGLQERPNGCDPARFDVPLLAARWEYEHHLAAGTLTWRHILLEEVMEVFAEPDDANDRIKEELVQVMAVAAAWIQHLERGDALAA